MTRQALLPLTGTQIQDPLSAVFPHIFISTKFKIFADLWFLNWFYSIWKASWNTKITITVSQTPSCKLLLYNWEQYAQPYNVFCLLSNLSINVCWVWHTILSFSSNYCHDNATNQALVLYYRIYHYRKYWTIRLLDQHDLVHIISLHLSNVS